MFGSSQIWLSAPSTLPRRAAQRHGFAIGKLRFQAFAYRFERIPESKPKLGDRRIRSERIEVDPCGSSPLSPLSGAIGNSRRYRGAIGAKQAGEISHPSRSAECRRLRDLPCFRQDCRVEPSGALAGERVALGGQAGDFVPRTVQIVLERVRRAGEIPSGRTELLEHELDLITSARMNFRSYFIVIILVTIAQMSNAVSIGPQ